VLKDAKAQPTASPWICAGIRRALKLPLELQVFDNSGQVTDAVASGQCDVAFMPRDTTREGKVDFGPAIT